MSGPGEYPQRRLIGWRVHGSEVVHSTAHRLLGEGIGYSLTADADSGLFVVTAGDPHARIFGDAEAVAEAVPGFGEPS